MESNLRWLKEAADADAPEAVDEACAAECEKAAPAAALEAAPAAPACCTVSDAAR